MTAEIAFIFGAYILGSIPVLYILGRLKGFDLRKEDDMHLALWHKVGHFGGTIGIAWDISKGVAVPMVACNELGFSPLVVGLSGLAVLTGMMWSPFLRFRGEKGNSTGIGVASALAPFAFLLALIPMLISAFIRLRSLLKETKEERLKSQSRAFTLGMILGFASLPPLSLIWYPREITWALLGMFFLIIIKRLTADLRVDFREAKKSKKVIVVNRILFDRNYRRG
jgi:glycerol-3-phosphate acyltransferase PlsY